MRLDISGNFRRSFAGIAVAALTMTGLAACGDDGNDTAAAPAGADADDGSALTPWTRAPLEPQAKALVDAYNGSHQNQVRLTIVPNDDHAAKVVLFLALQRHYVRGFMSGALKG
jgi:multiple sugar transport system substrate-binding protein